MKKVGIFAFMMMIGWASMSQVGIGTVMPTEDLHIAGANSTIRIESLNAANNPTYNDGVKLSPVYVDGNGDITLGNGTGPGGEPINFLIVQDNFIPDDPYGLGLGTGTVVNSDDLGQTLVEGQITTVSFTAPSDAMVEVKYGITMVVVGNDLTGGCPCYYIDLDQAVSMLTFLKVDLFSDGLDPAESAKEYGHKGQYYATNNQGSVGYPYMNGQAMFSVPAGTHTLYFYGRVNDDAGSYTSVGFGGAQDYLKIRVYN